MTDGSDSRRQGGTQVGASFDSEQQLAILEEFMTAIGASVDLNDIMSRVETVLVEGCAFAGGGVLLYSAEQDLLSLHTSWGIPASVVLALGPLTVTGSHFEPLVRRALALQENDFRDVDLFRQIGLAEARPRWQHYLALPLTAEQRPYGVLFLFNHAEQPFVASRLSFFRMLAAQLGLALYRAHLCRELQNANKRLRQVAGRMMAAEEEERKGISRELHDEAGQLLTALKLNLEMTLEDVASLRHTMPAQTDEAMEQRFAAVRQQLQDARALNERTMFQIQRIVHRLRPTALDDLGLSPALDGLCRDYAQLADMRIDYHELGPQRPDLSSPVKITLYRFVQAALDNATRHSQAKRVDVTLRWDAQTISLSVVDDGVGFNRQEVGGVGLLAMEERLESIGGKLEIDTAPGQGVRLLAWLPWEAQRDLAAALPRADGDEAGGLEAQ